MKLAFFRKMRGGNGGFRQWKHALADAPPHCQIWDRPLQIALTYLLSNFIYIYIPYKRAFLRLSAPPA